MIRVILIIFALTTFKTSASINCTNNFVDISSEFIVKEILSIDEDSGEPTKKQFIIYDTGDLVIVHQKVCTMTNVQIEYYYNNTNNHQVASNFLNILNNVNSAHNLTVNSDISIQLENITGNNGTSKNEIDIWSSTNSVEYELLTQTNNNLSDIYKYKINFYISIGAL